MASLYLHSDLLDLITVSIKLLKNFDYTCRNKNCLNFSDIAKKCKKHQSVHANLVSGFRVHAYRINISGGVIQW